MADQFLIRYSTEALENLGELRAFDRKSIRGAINQHLSHEPMRVSGSRIKRMAQPFWSQFRLRVGDFRVYYDVDETTAVVHVLRVLRKGTVSTPEELP